MMIGEAHGLPLSPSVCPKRCSGVPSGFAHGVGVGAGGGGGGVGVGVACGSGSVGQVLGMEVGPEFQTWWPLVLKLTAPAFTVTLTRHVPETEKQFAAPPAIVAEQLVPEFDAVELPSCQPPLTL